VNTLGGDRGIAARQPVCRRLQLKAIEAAKKEPADLGIESVGSVVPHAVKRGDRLSGQELRPFERAIESARWALVGPNGDVGELAPRSRTQCPKEENPALAGFPEGGPRRSAFKHPDGGSLRASHTSRLAASSAAIAWDSRSGAGREAQVRYGQRSSPGRACRGPQSTALHRNSRQGLRPPDRHADPEGIGQGVLECRGHPPEAEVHTRRARSLSPGVREQGARMPECSGMSLERSQQTAQLERHWDQDVLGCQETSPRPGHECP
jgi:hypothetical protein